MYEFDVLHVGERKDAGAITLRVSRPDNGATTHAIIDAGWQEDGMRVVEMIHQRYDTTHVDVALLTHPDGDHIGGMGTVIRELDVDALVLHRLDQRGGAGLPAADAVADLVAVATQRGTQIIEPWPGQQLLGGALTVLGPDQDYYAQMIAEQQRDAGKAAGRGAALREALRTAADRFLQALPFEEVPFDDGPGCGPRNNSSVVTLLAADDKRVLLTADAGVDAITRALDYAAGAGINATNPGLVQVPHHGSRRNASSALLDRMLGPIGQQSGGQAFVSVVSTDDPKHPSGRVVNAYARRGYPVWWTATGSVCWASDDLGVHPGYNLVDPLGPMDETEHEDD